MLNGIYAALISNESQLSKLVDDIAYKAYHSHEWDTMIRFHFRRRTKEIKLTEDIARVLDRNIENIAKAIYKFDRNHVVGILNKISVKIDITTDLLTFIVNSSVINNPELMQLEPNPIKKILDKVFI